MIDLSKYAKAIAGAVVTGGTAYYQANGDNSVTSHEWQTIAVATVVALASVWVVSNTPSTPKPAPAPVLHADDAALIVEDPTL